MVNCNCITKLKWWKVKVPISFSFFSSKLLTDSFQLLSWLQIWMQRIKRKRYNIFEAVAVFRRIKGNRNFPNADLPWSGLQPFRPLIERRYAWFAAGTFFREVAVVKDKISRKQQYLNTDVSYLCHCVFNHLCISFIF